MLIIQSTSAFNVRVEPKMVWMLLECETAEAAQSSSRAELDELGTEVVNEHTYLRPICKIRTYLDFLSPKIKTVQDPTGTLRKKDHDIWFCNIVLAFMRCFYGEYKIQRCILCIMICPKNILILFQLPYRPAVLETLVQTRQQVVFLVSFRWDRVKYIRQQMQF